MVKNRCKNGDHYWVSANVTPVLQHGQPVGYMSVRTKPSRAQVEAADALYAKMREANHDGEVRMRLHRGQLQRRGPARLWQRLTHLRSEEHTSELQSLMRISYAVFCLKKKKYKTSFKALDITHAETHQSQNKLSTIS